MDTLTATDPIQARRVDVLQVRVQTKLAELEEVIRVRQSGGFAPARALVLTNIGRTEMDDIRRTVALLLATENLRLRQRSAESASASRMTISLLITGGAIELAALLLFYGVAVRGLAERRRTMQERARLLDLEREARAAAEDASRAKDDFLAIASHELRTPITALRLQVQIVERTLAAAQASAERAGEEWQAGELGRLLELVHVLSDDSRRIGHLVGGLLDVTRIATGQFELHPEPGDLADIVRAAVTASQSELAKGPAVKLELTGPIRGRWDKMRLEQVVTNLLSNAVRHGGGKPITLRTSNGDGIAELVVEDRGPGIAAPLLPHLFDRFVRGDADDQGLGLGLYITRRIVEAHGGTIAAENRDGGGARFTVRVPRGIA